MNAEEEAIFALIGIGFFLFLFCLVGVAMIIISNNKVIYKLIHKDILPTDPLRSEQELKNALIQNSSKIFWIIGIAAAYFFATASYISYLSMIPGRHVFSEGEKVWVAIAVGIIGIGGFSAILVGLYRSYKELEYRIPLEMRRQ